MTLLRLNADHSSDTRAASAHSAPNSHSTSADAATIASKMAARRPRRSRFTATLHSLAAFAHPAPLAPLVGPQVPNPADQRVRILRSAA